MVQNVVAGAIALSSLVFLHQPFVTLSLVLVYLLSPLPDMLLPAHSAATTALLIANCFMGTALSLGFKSLFRGDSCRIPLVLSSVAAIGCAHGIARGNQAYLALGDAYQLLEFSALFFLVRRLVRTESQFRALANVIVGSILVTSVFQLADALIGASHFPHLQQKGIDVPRTINMNAPIALVALFATLPSARDRKWILAGIGILTVNLVWSYSRGLWLATAVSVLFLLIVQRGESRAALLKFGFAFSVIAISVLHVSGLDAIVAERLRFTIKQFGSVSKEHQVLSARRPLEYMVILPRIAEHPIVGNGLGATYKISGNAVLEVRRDEQIDWHYTHNLYLQVAFRLGIPALLFLVFGWWKYFQRSLGNLRILELAPANSALLAGLISAMSGEVTLCLTSPTLLNHPTAGVLACIIASTSIALQPSSDTTPYGAGGPLGFDAEHRTVCDRIPACCTSSIDL